MTTAIYLHVNSDAKRAALERVFRGSDQTPRLNFGELISQ